MGAALIAVCVAWLGSFYTFQQSVSNGALTMVTSVRAQIHSNLQFYLLTGLDIGANVIAADFGGLIDCGATSLEPQLDLAQYMSIQLQTVETVRVLAVLTPAAATVPTTSPGGGHRRGHQGGGQGGPPGAATNAFGAAAPTDAPTTADTSMSKTAATSGVALVLVGDATLGGITISRSHVLIGDPAADTLTAFPLSPDRRIDREHPELVLAAGFGTWIAEVRIKCGWRTSLTGGGWQWGDLGLYHGASVVTQPLYQAVGI